MHKKKPYPQHPIRAAVITFLGLSGFISVFIPFEERLREGWLFAFGYCAFLAVATVGILRLRQRSFVLLCAVAALALLSGWIGTALILFGISFENAGIWLKVSRYVFLALGVVGLCLVARGWVLCFGGSDRAKDGAGT